jgi:hypothetical protein
MTLEVVGPGGKTDSSGIPYDLDPHRFYDVRAEVVAAEAAGVERLVYKVFGLEFIKSLALALDPFSKFKLSDTRVATGNRTRRIQAWNSGTARSYQRHSTVISGVTRLDTSTPNAFDTLPYQETTSTGVDQLVNLTDQQTVLGQLVDTTIKSREPGVAQGEAEFFIPQIHSPARSISWLSNDSLTYDFIGGYLRKGRIATFRENHGIGPAGKILNASVQSLKSAESLLADNVIADNSLRMLANCNALRKSFTLFRSAAELRDLPYTLRSTVAGLKDVWEFAFRQSQTRNPLVKYKGFHKKVANQYLNKEFGWDLLVQDALNLLSTPARVAKRVNYLLDRNGQATTFRDERKYVEPVSSPPGFTYDTFGNETAVSLETVGHREVLLRCMVNCNVDLPRLSVPKLRENLSTQLWGLEPSPVDIYNLYPWTWLLDWFTGFGDYVNAFHAVNNDRSIINYGFISYQSDIEIRTEYRGKVAWTKSVTTEGNRVDSSGVIPTSSTSLLKCRYYKRKSLGQAFDVKPTWDLGPFTGFQLSILAALLIGGARSLPGAVPVSQPNSA